MILAKELQAPIVIPVLFVHLTPIWPQVLLGWSENIKGHIADLDIRQENEGSKDLNKRCLDVEFARETGENSVTGHPQVHHYAISVM